MAKKIIKVAGVAIIDQDKNKVLAGKRNADRLVGGMWEFPGGKIEKGETPQEAAKRELKEEFHDEVQIGPQLDETVSYEYDFGIVKLTVFFAKLLTNNFDLVAHSEVEWLSADEVQKLNWAPADAPLVKELARTNFRDIKF
ncbi:MAG: (deoxy)nucleoside triphosphate pyrophosphohydrolase [Lactobacillus delbrueckii]|uniref:8-oxo-dGTP diphosphatase n=1 Tax=Lactobacillus amylovorus subsp. animalium DSM 16698 TaxID=695563 RepID=A0A0R2KCR7_LACAM|nr:(deoxy)nucleoside triphosphate pyrophosphohydrolase [Lactobacillus amylovorus]MBS7345457.1 (deoxy)nucleoside triphosphate pyrophosphohydrolase [Caryophanon sp.]MDY5602641.1 (deoxy)nucleoside triphosphate pyrophosphohydrolase [Lactobacillus delbrueckii]KRN87262.1 mutator protein [Lactobacillus amylovorus DSM 16698]MDB6231061.1 (deoxy)nucleoside triphosphate pyrophosphohydrolase [Lactobacillus amylovorus]MDY5444801.1 (deoxy)nucleoside triphosphate pyrophosphohydrolase [Lactobacillus amylovoru